MNGDRFDFLTKSLKPSVTRRGAVATVALLAASVTARRSLAAQLAPATCAGEGSVCIMLTGCCDGFTCVTSAINPNLGVCQSGGSGGVEVMPPAAGGSASAQAATGTPTTSTGHTRTHGSNKKTRSTYAIGVRLDCASDPETITIKNKGLSTVTLTKFASSAIPSSDNPDSFVNNRTLAPGKHVVYYNGDWPGGNPPANHVQWHTEGIFNSPNDSLSVFIGEAASTPTTATCGSGGGTGKHKGHKKRKKKR